jgi:tetratricopeptide (TPR) repeat protein
MMKRAKTGVIACSVTAFLVLAACSSAPKKQGEVFTLRNLAAKQLELVNQASGQGRYADAALLLEEARRLAVSADDPPLLVKTGLAEAGIAFASGGAAKAFALWDKALAEAAASGDRALAALCRLHLNRARVTLLAADRGGEIPAPGAALAEVRAQTAEDIKLVEADAASAALGWGVMGLAEKAAGNYGAAEAALRRALAIHEKGRFLAEAAYDMYLIASVYSVAGRPVDAAEALKAAVLMDRKAENSYGLASDWLRLGEVYGRMGMTAEAEAAKERAAAIFQAIGLEPAAPPAGRVYAPEAGAEPSAPVGR